MSDSKIFECVKIFEVEQNQPVYGAREALTHGLGENPALLIEPDVMGVVSYVPL